LTLTPLFKITSCAPALVVFLVPLPSSSLCHLTTRLYSGPTVPLRPTNHPFHLSLYLQPSLVFLRFSFSSVYYIKLAVFSPLSVFNCTLNLPIHIVSPAPLKSFSTYWRYTNKIIIIIIINPNLFRFYQYRPTRVLFCSAVLASFDLSQSDCLLVGFLIIISLH